MLSNNKTFFLPCGDLYLLAVLNSSLMWWFNWRHLPHMKDEALTPQTFKMEGLPIAQPREPVRQEIEQIVSTLLQRIDDRRQHQATLIDWLRVEFEITKRSQKLLSASSLDAEAFVAEVRKLRGRTRPLSPPALRALRDGYAQTVQPLIAIEHEAAGLEQRLDGLVNTAFGLTPEEIELIWRTAPPWMPLQRTPAPATTIPAPA
jgi:hypothetical protein